MVVHIHAPQVDVLQPFAPVGEHGAQVAHIVLAHLHHIGTEVGVDVAIVQPVVGVEVLLWHTQYASHRLGGEDDALQVAIDEQHSGSWAVPPQGYGLLEE